jgi:hypothetical protein
MLMSSWLMRSWQVIMLNSLYAWRPVASIFHEHGCSEEELQ